MEPDYLVPRIYQLAKQFPFKIAIKSETQSVSYLELEKKTNRIANFMHGKIDKIPHVIILLDRSPELIESIIGLLKSGLVFVPLNPGFPGNRLKKMMTEIHAEWVITSAAHYAKLKDILVGGDNGLRIKTLLIDGDKNTDGLKEGSVFLLGVDREADGLEFEREFNDNCYIYFTSGSTGIPKGVLGRQTGLAHFIQWEIKEFGVDESVKVSQLTPPSFDPFLRDIFLPLMAGGTSCIPSDDTLMNTRELIRWIDENEITFIHTVPSLFKTLIPEIEDANYFHHLEYILLAGELLRGRDIQKFSEIFNDRIQLVNVYGPTETTLAKLFYRIKPGDANRTIIPVGKPIDGAQVLILDSNLRKCHIEKKGEIYIRTPFRSAGYYNDPGLNEKVFIKNPYGKNPKDIIYKTGDLGCLLPDGNIEISGRVDFQVKLRGVRIELAEIENRLLRCSDVSEAVVTAREEETGDKYLCAYIVPAPGKKPAASTLKELLLKDLPDYMIPSYFVLLDKLPLTSNGKVDRAVLPEPTVSLGQDYAAPRNEIEKKLIEIFAKVLGRNPRHVSQLESTIGIDGDFFELGGHSLKATVMVATIHKELNLHIPLAEIFRRSTIRALSEYIGGTAEERYESIQLVEEREYYELSSGQKRLYFLQQMNVDSTAYNIPIIIPLLEDADIEKLEGTFEKLIKRHESLRTSFHMINDAPVQRIHDEVEFRIEYFDLAAKKAKGGEEGRGDPTWSPDLIRNFIRPFDLASAPLMRVGLFKMGDGSHLLSVDLHHVITDGTSQAVLQQDFLRLYNGEALLSLPIQYKDFAVWQNSEKQRISIKRQEFFWLKEFEGEIPVLELPLDYPRPSVQSFEGSTITFEIEMEVTGALKAMSLKTGATMYMVLLSLYTIFLSKISSQEDIVVGSPVAGRRHADLEKIIGMFVNTLALRNFPLGEKTFVDFLEEVKENTLKAFENQDYPYEDLVEQAAASRDVGRNPLFDVMLVLQNMDNAKIDVPGINLTPSRYRNEIAKFDLTLSGIEAEDKLLFKFEYCTKLFKRDTVERFIAYFKNIVGDVIENKDSKISDLDIVIEEEKKRILFTFNNTGTEYPKDKTIHQLFVERVGKIPDHIALVGAGSQTCPFTLTYGVLNEQSDRWAGWLIEKGVLADNIIAIKMERSIEMIIAIFGILKSGGAYMPIDPDYPQQRIDYMLIDSGAKLFAVANDQEGEKVRRWEGERVLLEEIFNSLNISSYPLTFSPSYLLNSSNLAYIIYTSGSTGRPKGVMINHGSIVNLLLAMQREYPSVVSDTYLLKTSYVFDVSVMELFGWYMGGGRVYVLEKGGHKDPRVIVDSIERNKVSYINFVPSMFNAFIEYLAGENNRRLSSLKYIFLAGEVLSPGLVKKFRELDTVITLENLYGPTESSVYASKYSLSDWNEIGNVPIGRPLPNLKLYILNNYHYLQPVGIAGELCIGGSGLARGYLNNPELTHKKFIIKSFMGVQGAVFQKSPLAAGGIHYKTGDLARWLVDGNIEFLGRMDYQVKIRGFRVELGEIENRLRGYEGIKDVVVVVKEYELGDKYLCAYFVAASEYCTDRLREHLAKDLPEYMIPSYFVQLEKIPLTPSGKIDHGALPKPGLKMGEHYIAPGNEVETKLVNIWSDILNIPHSSIGVTDNFFELGGHSLKATIMMSRLHKTFDVKIELMEIFRSPNIRAIARLVKGLKKDTFHAVTPVEKKEYYPLSSAQRRLYFLQQLDLNSTGYNMPMILPLGQGIKKDKLESALKQLIARHESLRTSIERVYENVVQKIHPAESIEFSLDYFEVGSTGIEEIIKNYVRPFDLSRAPLIRSGLITRPGGHCTWMVDVHHIVSDGTSHTILAEDFMQLYGTDAPLEPLPVQYKDFAQWQNELFAGGRINDQEAYWRQLYAGEIPRLNLASDYKRPGVFTFAGDYLMFKLEREEAVKFKTLGARYGGTLYMNMMTVLNTLFYKYTGQTDIIIGTGIAGRRHVDIMGVVGMFVNTLAMRNYPGVSKSYESFFKEVIANSIKSFENQDVQFEELVDKLNLERDASRNPLFDIMMVVQNFRRVGEAVPGEKYSNAMQVEQLPVPEENLPPIDYRNPTSKFDMTFFVHEMKEDIYIKIQFYKGIFRPETIQRMESHLKNIIAVAIQNPGIKLKDMDFISEAEKSQVLYEFNNTAADYPRDKAIFQLFEEQVEKTPGHVAVVNLDSYLTYRFLDEQSNLLANYLYHESRVLPDQGVGIMMDRSPHVIIAVLGILKAGGAYVPISSSFPEERVKKMINDACIKVLLSQRRFIKTLNRMQWECGANLETFLCINSMDIRCEDETSENELMNRKLWEYVGETSVDEVTGGGWNSSYTGDPIPKVEMDEYGDNILKKLEPLLHKQMRVLEIGAASGISMFRIAPKVGVYYGTDLSEVIIEKNKQRIIEEGHKNIGLSRIPAHEIDRIEERYFDLVIINSVIQCFHGHNYLGKVIRKCIDLVSENGCLFIGDIMDQDLKNELIVDLVKFKQANRGKGYKTKTDWSEELFISRGYLKDLEWDYPEIYDMEFSRKIYTIENELTKFRYDALIYIDKSGKKRKEVKRIPRHKNQHDLRALQRHGTDKLKGGVTGDNLAYIMYTSGSTGIAKGTLTTHYNVTRLVKNTNYIEFKAGDRVMQLSDYAFDGSVFDIFGALLNGVPLVMVRREDMLEIDTLCRLIKRERITVFFVTTALFNTIVDVGLENLSGIRKVLFGGERVSVNHAARALEYLGKDTLVHVYGPTETTVYATYYAIGEVAENQITIPIGVPISNTTIYILDLGSRLTPIGVNGEIYIGGSGVCKGYLNNGELTGEKFIPNPFLEGEMLYRTGDLGRWLPNGNIEFSGRIDQQVKVRGYRIELGEVEKRVLNYPGIKECVVTAREDEKGSCYLCAYLAVEEKVEIVELKDYLAQVLPDYMIPGYFVQIEAFPLKSSGKIDLAKLPDPRLISDGDFVAPRDETEERMMEIWSEVLGIGKEMIGIDANFFELGGHSLKATVLISRIHKELNVKVPLAEVFKRQTIRELSGYINGARKIKYSDINPVEKKEYYALSSAQKRLYFLQQFDLNSTGYNISSIFPLGKEMEINKLEPVLKQLIARHESLRTSFVRMNDEVVQKIHAVEILAFSLEYYEVNEIETKDVIKNFIKPFDLSKAPLVRAGIIKLPGGEYIWMADVHHIISDGTSHAILSEDFISLYRGMELAPLRLQYKDFAQWQNRMLESGEILPQEDYWLSMFPGEIPRLDLPVDFKRPEVFTFAGDCYTFVLDAADADKFKTMGVISGATLYMNILAALNTLFYRYTGQEDIVIGSGIAGRPHADLQYIIGMFVNTLVMRNQPRGDKTYTCFLEEVVANSIKAFENQDVQFEELVEKLNPERDTARNPIFDISMVVQNFRRTEEVFSRDKGGKGNISVPAYRNATAKFDMTFFVWETGDDVSIRIEYYTGIFKRETIERMVSHLKNIIKAAGENPLAKLEDIEIISQEERNRVLYEFNDTTAAYPDDKTIHQLFEEQVERTPAKIAIVGPSGFGPVQITYNELDEGANRVTNYLCLGKHVVPEDRVGILLDKSVHMITAVLGILKAGAAYTPLDPTYPEKRIKTIIMDTGAGVLISQKKYLKTLNQVQWECPCLHSFLCLDSTDILAEEEVEKNELMSEELWRYVGETAQDEIGGGGWVSSFTGKPMSREEMDEYGNNILEKLEPLLHSRMRVLEIGTASGISMYRIAPHVGFYHGTDLSPVITRKNLEKVKKEGYKNIVLSCLAAHEIDKLAEGNFDLIIMNSVIQCFHGHNYLGRVIKKALGLLGEKGYLFIGDVMDLDKKEVMIRELLAFKHAEINRDKDYITKTDFSSELFIAKDFWRVLEAEYGEIASVRISDKIYTIENELTGYRYDVLIVIDKKAAGAKEAEKRKLKYREDQGHLSLFSRGKSFVNAFPNNIAYIIYTSGTSGRPKGVMIENRSLVNLCYWHNRYYQITGTDHASLYAGFGFDASVWELFPYLIKGSTLYIIDDSIRLDVEMLNSYFEQNNITVSFLPTQLCEQFMELSNCSLRLLLTGGDKLHRVATGGYALYNNYGPTENTVVTTAFRVNSQMDNIPIGAPVNNTGVFILDKEGRYPQPVGIDGELCISGNGLARGYMNHPELTAEKFDQDLWDDLDDQDEKNKSF